MNVSVDGSASEHTKTHTCQTEADRPGAVYFVAVFCDVAAEISAQVMVRHQITMSICARSICRIGPVTGIGLHVGSALVVSPTYEPQHYKTNKKTCAPSEDSDQPGDPPSLIRVFALRIMGS